MEQDDIFSSDFGDDEQQNANAREEVAYTEDNIVTLDWREHIRRRPGMYIGKLGDGSNFDDGIYVLLKEVLDNSIDEYMMGYEAPEEGEDLTPLIPTGYDISGSEKAYDWLKPCYMMILHYSCDTNI